MVPNGCFHTLAVPFLGVRIIRALLEFGVYKRDPDFSPSSRIVIKVPLFEQTWRAAVTQRCHGVVLPRCLSKVSDVSLKPSEGINGNLIVFPISFTSTAVLRTLLLLFLLPLLYSHFYDDDYYYHYDCYFQYLQYFSTKAMNGKTATIGMFRSYGPGSPKDQAKLGHCHTLPPQSQRLPT